MAMEGLIPFIYRAIKKHNVRRKYRCLSDGSNHYDDPPSYHQFHHTQDYGFSSFATPQTEKPAGGYHSNHHHRRHNSAFPDIELGYRNGRLAGGNFSPEMRLSPPRQGSIKRLLCIAGP